MKNQYTIDYKSFISDWRCRWIEVPKDIRRGKIWKYYDISVPDEWSSDNTYSIKMAKQHFFLIVDDGNEQYRYLLTRELLSLLNKYTINESDNSKLLEEIAHLKNQLEKANSTIRTLKEELLKTQMELEMERRKQRR